MRFYKKAKKYGKKTLTRVKALRVHPVVRTTENAVLGGYKQALDDSKKLSKGSIFASKSKKAKGIRNAVWGGNL